MMTSSSQESTEIPGPEIPVEPMAITPQQCTLYPLPLIVSSFGGCTVTQVIHRMATAALGPDSGAVGW